MRNFSFGVKVCIVKCCKPIIFEFSLAPVVLLASHFIRIAPAALEIFKSLKNALLVVNAIDACRHLLLVMVRKLLLNMGAQG